MTTATLLSRVLCLLLMLCYLKKEALFTFKLSAFDRSEVLPLIQKAIPSVIQQSIPAVSTTFLTALASTYSVTAIAAYGVAGKLETILFYPAMALNMVLVTIIGQCIGGARYGRAKDYRRCALGVRLWFACDSFRLSGRVRQTAFRSVRPERGRGGHCRDLFPHRQHRVHPEHGHKLLSRRSQQHGQARKEHVPDALLLHRRSDASGLSPLPSGLWSEWDLSRSPGQPCGGQCRRWRLWGHVAQKRMSSHQNSAVFSTSCSRNPGIVVACAQTPR